jgi:NitT/TauT family transport system permease protein
MNAASVAGRRTTRVWMAPSVRRFLLPALGILAVFGYWELHIRLFNVPAYLVPPPSLIAKTLISDWPTLQRNIGATAIEAVGGFVIGNSVAILLAILFVHNKMMERTLFPIAVAVRTVPIIAIAPILVLLLGNSYAPKIVIAALISFFPTLVNMVRGLESVEASALELMRVLSATRAQTFFKLRLPSSLPFLFAALKISSASSVIGAIVAEWIGADVGLGYLIIVSTFEFRTGLLYATTAMASLLALGLFLTIVVLERLIVRWQPDTPQR